MPKYNQSKTQKKLDKMKRWRKYKLKETLRRELKGARRNGDCLESFRYLSKDGYPELQVSQGYSEKRISIPIYVLIVWKSGTKLPGLRNKHGKRFSVSHLCGNKLCINRHHLVVETMKINIQRISCHSVGKCVGHANGIKCIFS